jgi:flagellar basal body-associated protein FliL
VKRARVLQIVVAVLILIGFLIGVFFYFGSSKHVKQAVTTPAVSDSTTPTTPSTTGTAPNGNSTAPWTAPDSTTGPTPAR